MSHSLSTAEVNRLKQQVKYFLASLDIDFEGQFPVYLLEISGKIWATTKKPQQGENGSWYPVACDVADKEEGLFTFVTKLEPVKIMMGIDVAENKEAPPKPQKVGVSKHGDIITLCEEHENGLITREINVSGMLSKENVGLLLQHTHLLSSDFVHVAQDGREGVMLTLMFHNDKDRFYIKKDVLDRRYS